VARRRWEFDLDDGHHVVELEHGYFLGKRTITVDGKRTIQSGNAFVDHSGEYAIVVGSHQATLQISTDGFRYNYDLVIDGRSVATGMRAVPPRPPIGPLQQQVFGVALLVWTGVLLPFFWTSIVQQRNLGPLALLLALGALAVALLYIGTRRTRVLRRLKQKGQLQAATVVEVNWGYGRGMGGVGTVQYEYEDTSGRRHRGNGPSMYPAEVERYAVGSGIQILVDPDHPGDSALP
jgi:Fas apoptotic inhibitory molecule (FAIM1)